MDIELYPITKVPENYYYEFFSEGPKGPIKKVVQYHRIEAADEMIFNLAFGDWNDRTRRIDDKIKSNNGDTEKILATVASTVVRFTDEHPGAIIYIEGSTPARTRLYQMGINKHWSIIYPTVRIEGLANGKWEEFRKDYNYECFLLKRR